jgi:hypothetical protein
MAVAIVTGRESLVRTNGALGRCLVTSARGLPDVYVLDRRDAAALEAVTELNSSDLLAD